MQSRVFLNDPGKTRVLVTAAAGDTGRPTVERLLEKGFKVRAFVRKDDARAQNLRNLGAEVWLGDISSLRDVRLAANGVQRAYFCCAIGAGLVENAAIFAQAAKEQDLELIVNMSHKQSRPNARSKVTQDHWLSEQIFDRSGVPSVHLRPTFFSEWLLYISGIIRYGRYMMPFNRESRFAPIAAADIARIIAGIMEKPDPYIGKALQLHGPVEYSHEELATEVGRVLGKNLAFEQVTASVFLETLGIPDATVLRKHFEAVTIDQQEGLIAGTDTIGREIIGGPLMTVEAFVNANRKAFELHYPLA
jgi:NAD(P)H dehydrogenase (quinone)